MLWAALKQHRTGELKNDNSMKRIVFYSWQSDLPNATNRGFIQTALENAAAGIVADATLAVQPVVDRDTQGVPGSPDIAATIFAKITASDVFVADVSIVARPADGRACPNPNVLIELGYAMKALGYERMILVFNNAFGKIEELPFDLRMRRILVYDMPASKQERAPERKKLEGQFDGALRAALQSLPAPSTALPSIPSTAAIENVQPNRVIVLRRDLDGILDAIQQREPRKHRDGATPDELIAAISSTQEPVATFSKIAETVAIMDDTDAALQLYRWFGRVFENYNLPENFSGQFSSADHDYFKFVGHELFVTFFAFLLREQRWGSIEQLLGEPIPMKNVPREHGTGNVYWEYASEHLSLLIDESPKRRRISLHADILHERHTTGGLAAVLSFDDFAAADYFLFLAGELRHETPPDTFFEWRPWSALYLKRAPTFLLNAEKTSVAVQVARAIGVPSVAEFKKRLAERAPRITLLFRGSGGFWYEQPLRDQDIQRIASR